MRADWKPAQGRSTCEVGRGVEVRLSDEAATVDSLPKGASVYDLLDASLAASTLLAAKRVLEGETVPIRQLTVEVSHTIDDAGWIVTRLIQVAGALSEEQRASLVEAADACAVYRLLRSGSVSIVSLENFKRRWPR